MKKDIEWFVGQMRSMTRLRDPDSERESWYISEGALLEALNQLDVPEVLSPDWISENVEYAYFDMLDGSGRLSSATAIIKPKKLNNLLVPKQEEVDRAYKDGYEKGREHGFYKGYREGLGNKGGEPEVLSQEWIKGHEQQVHPDHPSNAWWVPSDDLQGLFVPKQQEITHKQVEKYLLDKNIRVIDIDIYEEMQSELEGLKNGTTLSKTETVADVIADFYKSLERLKEVMSMEVEEPKQ